MFRKDTRGATAIEYGLIAAGIAVAIAAAVFALGGDLANLFGAVSDEVGTRTPSE
jgi:pilus assembly protein Flp/PilA